LTTTVDGLVSLAAFFSVIELSPLGGPNALKRLGAHCSHVENADLALLRIAVGHDSRSSRRPTTRALANCSRRGPRPATTPSTCSRPSEGRRRGRRARRQARAQCARNLRRPAGRDVRAMTAAPDPSGFTVTRLARDMRRSSTRVACVALRHDRRLGRRP